MYLKRELVLLKLLMHAFMTLIRELSRGKSLLRSIENLEFTKIRVSGKILDVAGGGRIRRPSYRRFMQISPDSEWTMADYAHTLRPDLCFDANHCWPMADESFDTVLVINSLHIFRHPEFVLQQATRVLRPQGRLIVTAPLIFNESPEPSDHYRFTSQCIRTLVQDAGLEIEQFIPMGGRFSCVVDLIRPYLRKLFLFLPMALLAHTFDSILKDRVAFERIHLARFGFIVIAKK